jgi:hypothetical protein
MASSTTYVVVPPFKEVFCMFSRQLTDPSHIGSRETSRICQLHRGKPMLGVTVSRFNVYMRRLPPFIAEKAGDHSMKVINSMPAF